MHVTGWCVSINRTTPREATLASVSGTSWSGGSRLDVYLIAGPQTMRLTMTQEEAVKLMTELGKHLTLEQSRNLA